MRKKSQEELGTLVTREMKVMLQDEGLTREQRFDVLAAVMFDTPIKNSLLASFAKSLKAGFEQINGTRYKAIDRIREFKRRSERIRRHGGNMDNDKLPFNSIPIHGNPCASIPIHGNPCASIPIHGELKAKAKQGNISPYKPPKGGGRKVPKAVEPEDLFRSDSKRTTASGGDWSSMTPEDVFEFSTRESATYIAKEIEQTEAFAHMRVNRRNLMRHLLLIVKKNCAGEKPNEFDGYKGEALAKAILDGLAAWTAAWKADDWQYAPGKITKWLADEKYLQPPRKKSAAPESVGSGCGDCGAEIA